MIVQRVIYETRRGRQREAIELLKNMPPWVGEGKMRILSGQNFTSPKRNVVILETLFENLAELETSEAEWVALPESGSWLEKWGKCIVDRTSEIWAVEQ